MVNTSKIRALLIDLDDCLYRNETMPKLVKDYIQSGSATCQAGISSTAHCRW